MRDAYLKQLDTHDHAQLSIRYQGADQGFTRELHNLNLHQEKESKCISNFSLYVKVKSVNESVS